MKELVEPFEVLDVYRCAKAKSLAHLLLYLWRHGQRHLGHWVTGGELEQSEDYNTDEQKRRDRGEHATDCEGQHKRRLCASVVGVGM